MQNTVRRLSIGKLLRSVIVAALVLTVLLLVVSILISEEVIPLSMGKVYVVVSLGIASAVSSGLLVRSRKERKMQAALINAGILLLLFVVYALVIGQGRIPGSQVLLLCACVTTGSITGCVLAICNPLRRKGR